VDIYPEIIYIIEIKTIKIIIEITAEIKVRIGLEIPGI
jgi:hypothetical protein